MRPIPQKLREQMANDPFMKVCCLNNYSNCDGHIEWHHNIIVAGRQLNADWAILPLCKYHHDDMNSNIKERLNWIMLNRASEQQLGEISKAINYKGLRDRLNKIYGKFSS